ncbi:MAG TPA: biotin-dependent carboxyltransferase family protein [Polyangiaceae bacterium]|jgi:allophanate hydrolase subunit 2
MSLVVRKVAGLATIQDDGRVGFAAQGVPRGGALVRSLAHRANRAVGNADGAACVEIFGKLVVAAEHDVVIATERGDARTLRAGEEIAIDSDGSLRVRYLAIAGGVEAPSYFGSRSTLVVAGIGRALRTGDRIAPSVAPGAPRTLEPFVTSGSIRFIPGPDALGLAPSLAAHVWRIGSASDRTGTRLEGHPLDAPPVTASSPMVCGAIQLPPSGAPIVIGPDGPTTGGYPIVGVLARADRDRFHALPIGAAVRFQVI